jgi:HEAT repeat protein
MRIRPRSGWGADRGAGGSESDPPAHRAVLEMAIPAVAGIALLAPVAHGTFPPALAWLLVVLNVAVVVGAIAIFVGARRRNRGSEPSPDATNRPPSQPSVFPEASPASAPPTPPTPPAGPPMDQVRADPAWALAAAGRVPPASATGGVDPETLTKLGDPDPFVRVSAVAALRGRVECETILVRALHDRYPIVRREVVRTLRTTGSSLATETLIKVAAHDPSAEVREEAVASLGALLREGKPETGA